jgi:hypothetical protein
MAHIELRMAKMLQRLLHPGRAAQQRFLMMNLAELDPLPLGPGWFDSSWELERGLEVSEGVLMEAALQRRFEDAMLEAALARLRSAAARAAKHKPVAVQPGTEPVVATPGVVDAVAMPRRGDNLIEFELPDVASLQLPRSRSSKARMEPEELELTLA